jgi:hypothetical protein
VPLKDLALAFGQTAATGGVIYGLWRLFQAKIRLTAVKKGGLRKWTPVVGELVIVGIVTARLFGNQELAQSLESAGTLFGLIGEAPISIVEVGAAGSKAAAVIATMTGLWLKFKPSMPKACR